MAAGTFTFYQSFREWMAEGTFDLNSDAFKISLHASTYTPSVSAHTVYADLTNELATANGYTNGGATLTSVTWIRSAGTVTFSAAATVWTASGGSITSRTAVVRKSGTANTRVDALVGYFLLDSTPADVTVTSGNTLTITPPYFSLS